METSDIIAVMLGILANSVYNIGLVFKKKGACTLPDIEKQSVWQNIKNFARCKTWLFGYILTCLQWFPLMYAIKIGSLSIVAPTMGVGFIVLIFFSWLYLKEPISILEISGIIAITIAVVTMNLVGETTPANVDLVNISDFFKQIKAIAFLATFAIMITLLLIATVKRKYPQAGGLMAMASGFSYAFATIFAKGAIGSLTFTNATDFLKNSLGAWQWWIYLTIMLMGYLVAFTSQQMALQKGKAIVVSPTLDVMNLFTQVMAGIIIFNEWTTVSLLTWQKAIRSICIVIIIIGVALLSSSTANEKATAIEKTKKEDSESTTPSSHIIVTCPISIESYSEKSTESNPLTNPIGDSSIISGGKE
ncbi:MAG: hypothetical protein FK734_16055 [Asgard group archaeon]|nr:hypothetical protein [Asgard group archaeon]